MLLVLVWQPLVNLLSVLVLHCLFQSTTMAEPEQQVVDSPSTEQDATGIATDPSVGSEAAANDVAANESNQTPDAEGSAAPTEQSATADAADQPTNGAAADQPANGAAADQPANGAAADQPANGAAAAAAAEEKKPRKLYREDFIWGDVIGEGAYGEVRCLFSLSLSLSLCNSLYFCLCVSVILQCCPIVTIASVAARSCHSAILVFVYSASMAHIPHRH
jgi:hypothetical protein